MTNSPSAPVPAGWYPDPAGLDQSRWWDGTTWSDAVQAPGSTYRPAAVLTAPEGTKPYHPLIWVIVALQILPCLGLLFYPWGDYMGGIMRSMMDSAQSAIQSGGSYNPFAIYSLMFTPGYIAILLGSWLLVAISIVLAWLDRRSLLQSGVPKPFHWAWSFISPAVYIIGRSVIVRRRTGSGIAPVWVWVVSYIVSTIALSVVMTAEMFAMMSSLQGLYGEYAG
jgi:hypothetical protein